MPKRDCKNPAAWKLEPGRGIARLSAHYKLDCDFGTPVVGIYQTGDSSDPLYLCQDHVGEVRPAEKKYSDVRLLPAADDTLNEAVMTSENGAPRVLTENVRQAPAMPVNIARAAGPAPVDVVPAAQAPRTVAALKTSAPTPMRAGARSTTRDLTFGNSAKALVDEAIWNLATGDYELYRAALRLGKSPMEAAQAAGGQLAVVHRKICEYAVKIETVLLASTAKINANAAVDTIFERATNEILSSETIAESEREAALDQLGSLQQSLSKAIGRGADPELSPLQAYRLAFQIGERAGWGRSLTVAEALKPTYRHLFASVRSALRASAPHANHLEERLINLYAAKAELEAGPTVRAAQSLSA